VRKFCKACNVVEVTESYEYCGACFSITKSTVVEKDTGQDPFPYQLDDHTYNRAVFKRVKVVSDAVKVTDCNCNTDIKLEIYGAFREGSIVRRLNKNTKFVVQKMLRKTPSNSMEVILRKLGGDNVTLHDVETYVNGEYLEVIGDNSCQ
jgi:hypothetical protein